MLVQEILEPVLDILTEARCALRTPTFELRNELILPGLLWFLVLVEGKTRIPSGLIVSHVGQVWEV
jgi:hypothetical protein